VNNALRLEVATQRARIAALEATVSRLVEVVLSSAAAKAQRIERRREIEMTGRYELIRDLMALLPGGGIARKYRLVARIFEGRADVPNGASGLVAQLRAVYGNNGPTRRTVYRACQLCQVDAAPDDTGDDDGT
jgi:hypothetical protein